MTADPVTARASTAVTLESNAHVDAIVIPHAGHAVNLHLNADLAGSLPKRQA